MFYNRSRFYLLRRSYWTLSAVLCLAVHLSTSWVQAAGSEEESEVTSSVDDGDESQPSSSSYGPSRRTSTLTQASKKSKDVASSTSNANARGSLFKVGRSLWSKLPSFGASVPSPSYLQSRDSDLPDFLQCESEEIKEEEMALEAINWKISRKISSLNRKVQELDRDQAKLSQDIEVSRQLEAIQRGGDSQIASILYEYVYFRRLRSGLSHHYTVFLALGNPFEEVTPELASGYERLVKALNDNNFFIYFDADAKSASLIRNWVPEKYRLGVSGDVRNSKASDVIYIPNPYLRLNALSEIKNFIFTPNSILALGIQVESHNKSTVYNGFESFPLRKIVFDATPRVEGAEKETDDFFGLIAWSDSLARPKDSYKPFFPYTAKPVQSEESDLPSKAKSLGVAYNRDAAPRIISNVSDLGKVFRSPSGRLRRMNSRFLTEKVGASSLNYGHREIYNGLRYARESFTKCSEMKEALTPYAMNAVLFGSAQYRTGYEKLVSDVIKVLAQNQISVSTGGAGGLMQVANEAARRNRTLSIGVPITSFGFHEVAQSKTHNLTIHSSSYETRIPLLLLNRDLIIVAPGGEGTMKELATTWVNIASNEGRIPAIVFLGEHYYAKWVELLHASELPKAMKDRIYLVSSAIEMNALIDQLRLEKSVNLNSSSASSSNNLESIISNK